MAHDEELFYQTMMVRKKDDPQWFKRVHSFEIASFKKYIRGLVEVKKLAVKTLKNHPNAHPICVKEQHSYACMLVYLHNGNREKFEEYKKKTRDAMSETLTMLMEQGDHDVHFVQESDQNFGKTVQRVNESASLRQGNKMKMFDVNLRYYELRAEFVDAFETPATKGCAVECDLTTKKPNKTKTCNRPS